MTEAPLAANALISLAQTRSSERRNELAMVLMDMFHRGNTALTERERAMMTDILRRLLGEIEAAVRASMAERLADMPDAPRTLIQDLANDKIEVAWPLLQRSPVLEDVDLVEIIRQRSLEHKLAITRRGVLSEDVADALARTDEPSVIVGLLNNSNAQLSRATMEYLVEQSERVDDFQEPLLKRDELPQDLALRMFTWVSAALRDHLIERYKLNEAEVDDALEAALDSERTRPGHVAKESVLVAEIERAGMMNPKLLHDIVEAGHLGLYARFVQKYTGIRRQLSVRLFFEAAGEGLAVLCRALDLTKSDFIDIYTISRKARPCDPDQLAADCDRLGHFYTSLTSDAARAVVVHWRRNPGYLAALKEIRKVIDHHG